MTPYGSRLLGLTRIPRAVVEHGACVDTPNPEQWFPAWGDKDGIEAAREACLSCAALTECRAWAIADPTLAYGVFGGLTDQQRRAARRRRKA